MEEKREKTENHAPAWCKSIKGAKQKAGAKQREL
jgi:hypothetical protein